MLTLQKSLPCSYASGKHSATADTDIQFKLPRRRANIQQGVCCYAGRRIYSQLHIAISPYAADGILSAFVVIFIISVSISRGSGLDNIKYQHSSKLWPLWAMLFDDTAYTKRQHLNQTDDNKFWPVDRHTNTTNSDSNGWLTCRHDSPTLRVLIFLPPHKIFWNSLAARKRHFGFCPNRKSQPFRQKPKSRFFANAF